MKGLLRRLRGILGTALTWGVGWFGLGGVATAILSGVGVFEWWGIGELLKTAFALGTGGFVAGGAFATLLAVLGRHKSLEELSAWRMAPLGGLGGLAMAAFLQVKLLPFLVAFAVLGMFFGAGTVAVAQRGSDMLTEGDEDPDPRIGGAERPLISGEGDSGPLDGVQ